MTRERRRAAAIRVGVDFDNTIVCYDRVFHEAATSEGLVPPDLPLGKTSVKDYLVGAGREPDWTRLQGRVYGVDIARAEPYPGVREFFAACRRSGVELAIVSHKTRYPYAGPRHDLHDAARRWLLATGLVDAGEAALPMSCVHLVETRAGKFERIRELRPRFFVDDLADFLLDPAFPAEVERIWFEPSGASAGEGKGEGEGEGEGKREGKGPLRRARSWQEIQELVLGAAS